LRVIDEVKLEAKRRKTDRSGDFVARTTKTYTLFLI
jgi:hypothetical protein